MIETINEHQFEVKVDTDLQNIWKRFNKIIGSLKENDMATRSLLINLAIQSNIPVSDLQTSMLSSLNDYPKVILSIKDKANLYRGLDWQRTAARHALQHYANANIILVNMLEQCRYLHIPLGNFPDDPCLFACDLFYGRHLVKHNHLLWCSLTDQPDLGGKEQDDYRMLLTADVNQSNSNRNQGENNDNIVKNANEDVHSNKQNHPFEINHSGFYPTSCIEFELVGLAIWVLAHRCRIPWVRQEWSPRPRTPLSRPTMKHRNACHPCVFSGTWSRCGCRMCIPLRISSTICLELKSIYHCLWWFDDKNYCGFRIWSNTKGHIDDQTDDDEEEEEETIFDWNMIVYLPRVVQDYFESIVIGFARSIYDRLREEYKDAASITQTNLPAKVLEYCRGLFTDELYQQLMSVTNQIERKLTKSDFDATLPTPLTSTSPTLEFVKSVCCLLFLLHDMHDDVMNLRRDLLKLLQLSE